MDDFVDNDKTREGKLYDKDKTNDNDCSVKFSFVYMINICNKRISIADSWLFISMKKKKSKYL